MQLGIVGDGTDIEALAAEAAARGGRILRVADPRDRTAIDRLLDPGACDLVAVGAAGWPAEQPNLRADTVRMLVQTGRTLILPQPLELSMLWAYELDMIRQDSGAVILPWLPARLHPFVARLKAAIEAGLAGAGGFGPLETLRLERSLPDRSRDRVLAALARDADLVRVLVGEPARLTTLGAAEIDSAWGTLAVGFSGPGMLPVRWHVGPGSPPTLRIIVQHAGASLAVEAPDDGPWTWSGPAPESGPFDPAAILLGVVAEATAGGARERAIPPATWADAARGIELAEAVPRSLSRGRAVDLHHEEFSELGTFRGTMASLGCGLVLAALVILVLATLMAGIAREAGWALGERLASAWPIIVLVVLAAFLMLQLLPLLIGPSRRPGQHETSPPGKGPRSPGGG